MYKIDFLCSKIFNKKCLVFVLQISETDHGTHCISFFLLFLLIHQWNVAAVGVAVDVVTIVNLVEWHILTIKFSVILLAQVYKNVKMFCCRCYWFFTFIC